MNFLNLGVVAMFVLKFVKSMDNSEREETFRLLSEQYFYEQKLAAEALAQEQARDQAERENQQRSELN